MGHILHRSLRGGRAGQLRKRTLQARCIIGFAALLSCALLFASWRGGGGGGGGDISLHNQGRGASGGLFAGSRRLYTENDPKCESSGSNPNSSYPEGVPPKGVALCNGEEWKPVAAAADRLAALSLQASACREDTCSRG